MNWAEVRKRAVQRLGPNRWGVAMILACAVIYIALYATDVRAQGPDGDGFYSWLYARSIAFDGDINFANDYRLCGDPWQNGIDRGTGRLDNPFYIGPSLFWAPVLWVLRHIVRLPPGSPPSVVGGCSGPLAGLTLGVAPLLGVVTVALGYRVARRFTADGPAALTAGIMAAGSTLTFYATTIPSYSHVYATVCVAFLILAAVRASEQPGSWRRWLVAALALALCVFQRLNMASMALIPAAVVAQQFWGRWRGLLARLCLLGAGAVLGAIPTLMLYKHLYGSITMLPQGRYYVQFGHAHPFLLMFSPNGGLFFVTPAVWLAVIGIAGGLKRQPWLIGAALLTAAAEIYVASCPFIWDAGATFGARLLTPLTPLFILLSTFAVASAHSWVTARPERARAALGLALIIPFAFCTVGMVAGVHRHRVPMRGASQEATYAGGVAAAWAGIDEVVGDLAILPAEILYSWRYGVPRQTFRQATFPRALMRDYKSMKVWDDVLRFGNPGPAVEPLPNASIPVLRGFMYVPGGAMIVSPKATAVFTVGWPYGTRISVAAHAPQPSHLKVGFGRFWGTRWLGEIAVAGKAPPEPWPALPLPRGSFDSGLTEVVFECTPSPCKGLVVEAIRLHDDNSYAPALR
jgi:hypothetical protein